MKVFDPDDISSSVDGVLRLCEDFEADPSYSKAAKVMAALSCMKLVIGEDRFDGLPSFSRWLKLAARTVERHDAEKEERNA